MKNIVKTLLVAVALFTVSTVRINAAPVTNIETFSVPIISGYTGQVVTCSNLPQYYGIAKITNSVGGFWLTPPSGTTQGTFSDISDYPTGYVSSQIVTRRRDLHQWYGCGPITFSATNSTSYSLGNYINAPYPANATNMIITLQVVWQ